MPVASLNPDRIGPYQVLRPIAQGGMAEVYEVLDPITGDHLALKLLVSGGNAGPRFDREYEALTRLNHPNIVRVYTYGIYEGMPWFTMELLAGVPLQRWVKERGRPGSEARQIEVIRLGFLIADALHYVHERGLVHRDLKSANVLVLPDGRVKLLDFGTASIRDPLMEITEDGEFVGTFSYASPEQITGRPLDHRSDLYSFGILLFRLITGQRPFEAENPAAIAKMHVSSPPPRPSALVPEIHPELERLILWLMEKDPARRPAKTEYAARFLQDLSPVPLTVVPTQLVAASDLALGREEEVRRVYGIVGRGFPGTVILLLGRDGCGRVGLAESIFQTAETRGWRVAMRTLGRRDPLSGLRQLFEDIGAQPSSGEPFAPLEMDAEPDEYAVLERYAEAALRAVCDAGQPVWLGLHHVHRLGPKGSALIHRLRKFVLREKIPLYFLFTMEQDGMDGGVMGEREAFPGAHRVVLGPLGPAGVAITTGALLHRRPPPIAVSHKLHAATGGQPDYLISLLRRLVADGALVGDDHHPERVDWRLGLHAEVRCDAATRHLRGHLRDLSAASRRILELVALAGMEISIAALARAQRVAPEALDPELEVLSALGWVDRPHQAVRPAFPLALPMVVEAMAPCRVWATSEVLARALQDDLPSAAQVRLAVRLGRADQAVQQGLVVVRQRMALRDDFGAFELLELLLPLRESLSDGRLAGELSLAHTQVMLKLYPMEKEVPRSLQLAERDLGEGDVRLQMARAGLFRVLGHYPNHRKHLQRAWQGLDPMEDAARAFDVAEELSQSHIWSGELRSAREWAERAGEVIGTDEVLRARHALLLSTFDAKAGDVRKVEETASGALRVLERAGALHASWDAVLRWAEALRQQGRFSEALSVLYLHVPEARREDVSWGYARLGLLAAEVEVDLCRLGKAAEWVEELGTLFARGEHLQARLEADTVAGRIALESGQYFEAAEVLERVYLRARTAGLLVTSETARALWAETLWHLGEYERAAEAFRSAILGLLGTGDKMRLLGAVVRQGRVMAEVEEPAIIYTPVKEILETRPVMVAQLEYRLAQGRWLKNKGKTQESYVLWREAAETLQVMAESLHPIDRSALRVHPWSTQIRRGMRGG